MVKYNKVKRTTSEIAKRKLLIARIKWQIMNEMKELTADNIKTLATKYVADDQHNLVDWERTFHIKGNKTTLKIKLKNMNYHIRIDFLGGCCKTTIPKRKNDGGVVEFREAIEIVSHKCMPCVLINLWKCTRDRSLTPFVELFKNDTIIKGVMVPKKNEFRTIKVA